MGLNSAMFGSGQMFDSSRMIALIALTISLLLLPKLLGLIIAVGKRRKLSGSLNLLAGAYIGTIILDTACAHCDVSTQQAPLGDRMRSGFRLVRATTSRQIVSTRRVTAAPWRADIAWNVDDCLSCLACIAFALLGVADGCWAHFLRAVVGSKR
jgi:hypothetical protein